MSVWAAIVVIVFVVTAGEVLQKALEDRSGGRGARAPRSVESEEELDRLRERVEVLAERVERLSEEQRFLTRLLEERSAAREHPRSEDVGEW